MGFSSSAYRKKREERPWKINPVWRGIGCILIVVIILMSWFGSIVFLKNNKWFPIPPELNKAVVIPFVRQPDVDKIIVEVNTLLQGVTYANFFFTIVFLFIGFGILSVIYAMMYRVAGPPRYGQFDARPIKAPPRRR